jgi:2-polyprenyl-3-methyl-5-hydroxy-6-metoxy-1,4-benzoquinol methylase
VRLTGNLRRSRYDYAEQVARRSPGAAVFDVGAGNGLLLAKLK